MHDAIERGVTMLLHHVQLLSQHLYAAVAAGMRALHLICHRACQPQVGMAKTVHVSQLVSHAYARSRALAFVPACWHVCTPGQALLMQPASPALLLSFVEAILCLHMTSHKMQAHTWSCS